MMFFRKIVFLFFLVLFLMPLFANAQNYSFGGSCAGKGPWTEVALAQTQKIREIVEGFRDDLKCIGIETVIPGIHAAEIAYKETIKTEAVISPGISSLSNEMSSLRSVLGKGVFNNEGVFNTLMNKTVESGTTRHLKSLKNRTVHTARVGMELLDQSLELLTGFDECLMGRPNQAASLIGAIFTLSGAFIGSGDGLLGKVGYHISNIVDLLRNRRFSKILKKLDETDFWLSISCMIETTTNAYCSTNDRFELLKVSQKANQLYLQSKEKNYDVTNPLEGHFILTRELPVVSEWINKIQFGVVPRFEDIAEEKNEILDNINDFRTYRNIILGIFSERLAFYEKITDPDSKKNFILDIIRKLSWGISDAPGVNFFTMSVLDEYVPFYLIGRQEIAVECAASKTQGIPMDWYVYMQKGGRYISEFDDLDLLIKTIKTKMDLLIKAATKNAENYFQQRLIVDMPNLIDETLTGQTITVLRSLERIEWYLDKLVRRYIGKRCHLKIIPDIIDTRDRINYVLEHYYAVKNIINRYLDRSDRENWKGNKFDEILQADNGIREAYSIIVMDAFEKFNILFQSNTFLIGRINTFVKFDIADMVKNSKHLTDHQRQLLIVSGDEMIERLKDAHGLNIVDVEMDLQTAKVVNKRNLESIESLFIDTLLPIVSEVDMIAEGRGNSNWKLNLDVLDRLVYDTSNHDRLPMVRDWDGFFKTIWSRFCTNFIPFRTGKMAMEYLFHHDRYHLRMPDFHKIDSDDDANGSFGRFRDRLCIQSLAFEKSYLFRKFCRRAVLENKMGVLSRDKRLQVSYDKMLHLYDLAKRTKDRQKIRSVREKNVCAFRDYVRNNKVYWMLREF